MTKKTAVDSLVENLDLEDSRIHAMAKAAVAQVRELEAELEHTKRSYSSRASARANKAEARAEKAEARKALAEKTLKAEGFVFCDCDQSGPLWYRPRDEPFKHSFDDSEGESPRI